MKLFFESPLTSMHNIIEMTIHQCTPYLPCELSCDTLAQTTMANDIVQHLTTIDIFRNHVIVVLMDYHLAHATDIGMVKKH